MSEEEADRFTIRADQSEAKPLILVPDGTLCFCKPIYLRESPDRFDTYFFETVWLKPNEDEVWEATGPLSGCVYRHVGWLRQAHVIQAEAMERWEDFFRADRARQTSRMYRIKSWLISLKWRLFAYWIKIRHKDLEIAGWDG